MTGAVHGAAGAADPVVQRLESLAHLYPKLIDLSLGRIRRLLAALDHPERRLPPVIHVAGTNGKGSVIAFLRAMLEAAGWRVHVYTSPHLVRFSERIRLAGSLIAETEALDLLAECEAANGDAPITLFEIVTAMAFLAFSRRPADVLLLETGLGGRVDATNVVDRPLATAITAIGYDHMDFLGESIAEIAAEKAGIIKPGVPCILAPQTHAAALPPIRQAALARGAPLLCGGLDWRFDGQERGWTYAGGARHRDLPAPALAGRHQIANAAQAIAILEHCAAVLPVDAAAIRQGLARVHWPGRLQRLTTGPLTTALPPGWQLWLDGAHNRDGAAILAAALAAEPLPTDLIFGALKSKDAAAFLACLKPQIERLVCITLPDQANAQPAESLAILAQQQGIAARTAASLTEANEALMQAPGDRPRRLVIAGSLYLAGAALAANGTLPD